MATLGPRVARIRVYLPALTLPTPKSDLPFSNQFTNIEQYNYNPSRDAAK